MTDAQRVVKAWWGGLQRAQNIARIGHDVLDGRGDGTVSEAWARLFVRLGRADAEAKRAVDDIAPWDIADGKRERCYAAIRAELRRVGVRA